MKFKALWKTAAVCATLCSLVAGPVNAATMRFESQPGSSVKVDGTSTIHDWTVESKIVGGFIEVQTDAPIDTSKTLDLSVLKASPKVEVTILVRSLKSNSKGMDDVMQKTMNAQAHPRIQYRLTEWALKEAPKSPTGPAVFDTKGELTVSGTKKIISMPVTLQLVENGRLKASGEVPLKMTDFGIKPPAPSLALGLVKTGDDVKVSFVWMTAPSTKTAQN